MAKVGVGFGVMILHGTKVLLGKRHDNPSKADSALNGAGTWTMPGGKLEFGETLEEGAKREVLEETDILINNPQVLCLNQDIIDSAHFITIGILVKQFTGNPTVMEPDEITEWEWFGLDNLPEPMYLPSKKIFNNYRQNIFYIKDSVA